MGILEAIKRERLFFDGAMGSQMQALGLPEGMLPDIWSKEKPELLETVHEAYLKAGSRIITTNTFGLSEEKLRPYGLTPEELMEAAVNAAGRAISRSEREAFIAADIGPTGKLLKPYGDLDFEDAVTHFKRLARAAEHCGADLILIETMSDLYECKAAVLGAKEGSSLPVFATLAFNEKGKLFTGGDAAGAAALLEGLGADAIGLNCGFGPKTLLPVLKEMHEYCSLPLIFQPNAGLPKTIDGETVYELSPEAFAAEMREAAPYAALLGGCCGTAPAHIAALCEACRDLPAEPAPGHNNLIISSYCKTQLIGRRPVIIGERINPTGKKKLQKALRGRDTGYVLREALKQEEAGADILDLNVGLPDIDEPETLCRNMEAIQAVSGLPLQLDTSDPAAMERALRRYNGKALVNSVSGKRESLAQILPLVQKYGGGLVCLCLDDDGIPETAQGRLAVAEKIVREAEAYGIPRRDLLIDTLTMPVSAGEDNGRTTLEALGLVKEELGVKTVLGVSNVSFGLPMRSILNTSFFTLALAAGLDAAIINPNSEEMMGAYMAYAAVMGHDPQSQAYIAHFSALQAKPEAKTVPASPREASLRDCVKKGLLDEAVKIAKQDIEAKREVLEIINEELVPALDEVGDGFAQGRIFLPQLLMSAEAAKAAFEVLKQYIPKAEGEGHAGRVVLATVKGDIHDIGKNIVKVLLESHRFSVLDLGKDVDPEAIVDAVRKENIKLLGLSALMTTTAPYMEKTIKRLHEEGLPCKVAIGGAVINSDYADNIHADFYAKDAMDTVKYAERVFASEKN